MTSPLEVAPGDDGAHPSRYRFADVEFDAVEGQLLVGGKAAVVEPRPLRLLLELLRHVNEVVTKEELFESVWEGRVTVDHVLANAVSKLRTALGEAGAARLVTVPRVGYRLVGPVQRLPARVVELRFHAGQPVPGRESYVLERALGGGHHGDVWLARHTKLGQSRVFKFAFDGPRLTALKREYTLYRVLAHELGPRDDFAKVVDANFVAAPHFIECEFGGESLLEWAEDANHLTAMPMQVRVALFIQVAQAVADAHGVGVLHKDLKPSNVLVTRWARTSRSSADDTEACPWQVRLTDFGSGRLLDASRIGNLQLTAQDLMRTEAPDADTRSGTLMYLAPELLAGSASTVQSDVYALGMILWQVLAGDLRRPMVTGWQRDVEDDLLREDIGAATEGHPGQRLKSAADLVERLRSLPARREAQAARIEQDRLATDAAGALQRAVARRPWIWAAACSLAVGLLASLVFAVQARKAQHLAEEQARQATAQKARADAINVFLTDDLLSGADIALVDSKGSVSIPRLAQRAAERAGERFKGQRSIEAEVRGQVAKLLDGASQFEEAEKQYRQAVEAARASSGDTLSPLLLKLQFRLAAQLATNSKMAEARSQLDSAERDLKVLPLADRISVEPDAEYSRLMYFYLTAQYPQAVLAGRRLLAMDKATDTATPESAARLEFKVADALFKLGKLSEAESLLVSVLRKTTDVAPVLAARTRISLARVRVGAGNFEGEEAALIEARDALRTRLGPREYYVAVADAELGNLYDGRGEFARAAEALRNAYEGMTLSVGESNAQTRVIGLNLAIVELNEGRAAAALQRLEGGRAWFAKNLGGDEGAVVHMIDFERARALTSLGRTKESLPILNRLKHERLAQASPSRDWEWRLQAERGRAMLAGGDRPSGLQALLVAVPAMAENGTPAWVLDSYRRLLQAGIHGTGQK